LHLRKNSIGKIIKNDFSLNNRYENGYHFAKSYNPKYKYLGKRANETEHKSLPAPPQKKGREECRPCDNHDCDCDKPQRRQEEENDEDEDEDEDGEEMFGGLQIIFNPPEKYNHDKYRENQNTTPKKNKKSENFEIVASSLFNFTDIGGYETIKSELMQCADMLVNYEKYKKYNVRTPKGLILEGPPGTGKTLLAKCFAGQINVSFIPVSGAQFQEKFIGVGSSRVRELFKLAMDNKPCIIFIDEIDAIGRKRVSDDSGNNSERDSTLNELLVSLDGFKSTEGIFIMGATNRVDLLDTALTRPGRIDKSIYIGLPDRKTRESIIDIHLKGKPYGHSVTKDHLVELTQGLSGAQIENLLNEALLFAIRNVVDESDTVKIEKYELDFILNRILVGSQSTENIFTEQLLYQIAIHEMGHAIVSISIEDYNKLIKVSLNTWSPKSPGYTLFDINENEVMSSKIKLANHLAVLLAGRIAEETFFNEAITTGASKDLEEVRKLAYSMVVDYGMGTKIFYPSTSDKSKRMIDEEVNALVENAYNRAKMVIVTSKPFIEECAKVLVTEHVLTAEYILKRMKGRYPHLIQKTV
jgi:cell division protease FtsH